MLNIDRQAIDDYITETNHKLHDNNKDKELTQFYIEQLNEYIRQIHNSLDTDKKVIDNNYIRRVDN